MRRIFVMFMFWVPMGLIFKDPFFGILHYTLSSIIRPEHLTWGDSSAAGRIYLTIQVLTLISWMSNREKLDTEATGLVFQNKILWFIGLEMTHVSYFNAFDFDTSWYWASNFWKMTLYCFLLVKSFDNAKKIELYYGLSLIWLTLLAMWGIQQKFAGNDRLEGLGGALIPDSNGIAALYVMYTPVAYYAMFSRTRWIRYVAVPAFILFSTFILFSGSRGGFVGLIVVMAWIFLSAKGLQKFKMMFNFMVLGSVLIGLISKFGPEGFFDEYTDRLATILGQKDEDSGEVKHEGSAEGRKAMWKGALHVYGLHPEYWWFGLGLNNYSQIYYKYHIDEIAEVVEEPDFSLVLHGGHGGKDMHNSYYNMLLGGGAITTVTWLSLLAYAFVQAHFIPKRYPKIVDGVDIHNHARAVEAGILGWSFCMTLGSREFIDYFYWFLVMPGVLANLGRARLKREALGREDEEFDDAPSKGGAPTYGMHR